MPYFKQRLSRFWKLNPQEAKDMFISILVVTFIFAYNDGKETFDMVSYLLNILITFVFVTISIYGFIMGQKFMTLYRRNYHEFRMWGPGLLIGIIASIISGGFLHVILIGGPIFTHSKIHRLGKFRYGLNINDMGKSALMGPIVNFLLATIGFALSYQLKILPDVFLYFALINIWLTIYNLLPIPRMTGIHIFYWSRLTYVFVSSTLIAYLGLAVAGVFSWIIALFIGTGCWFGYYITFEKG